MDAAAIFASLQSMTPSQAAQSLDLTRKQEYDAVRKGQKTSEEREALWMQVWMWFRAAARHPFAAKVTDPAILNVLCMGAKAWDDWSHLETLTIGPNMQSMPHRYLSLCFYYASYVANVYRYVRQAVEDADTPADLQAGVDVYHRQVSLVLGRLKERVGRPILEVAILSSASKVKHHLFHELFGYPKQGGPLADPTLRLYLPAQLLFHSWTAINMDGRAFRLYHVMFEFDWIARVGWKDTLQALRLAYLDNTVCLGRVLTIPKLNELSIRSSKEYARGVNLFDKQKDVLSNLSKLILTDLPSLRRLGSDGVVFQRLKELHLENLSFPGFPLANLFQASPPQPPLKRLILRGPRLSVPPQMEKWLVLPPSLSEIVLDNLPGVSSLPLAKSSIASVTLANLALPLLSYMSFVSSAGPAKLVLDTLRVVTPPPGETFPDALPVVRDMSKAELGGIISANGAWNRLTECTLSGFSQVTDFTGVFERAASTLERLAIYGSVGHISLPFRELRALKDVKIDKASGVTLSERLTPNSRAYWTRQALIIAGGAAAVSPPRKKQAPGALSPTRKLDFDDDKGKEEEEDAGPSAAGAAAAPLDIFSDDEEPVSDIFVSLEDMLIPFGAGRDKMTGQLAVPPWLPRNLEQMDDKDPNKRLFASTWLEWETAVSSWLATEDEGLMLFPAIGDLRVSKVVERDDGEPFAVIFTTAGLPLPPQPRGGGGADSAERILYSERNRFLAGLLTQEFPVMLRYFRKERVIGRNEQTGTVETSDGINLSFLLEALDPDSGVLAGIVFSSDEFVTEKDGLSKSCRVGFSDTRARVKLDLGKLTLLFRREDDPFPVGFTFKITLAAAVRFLALQSAVLLTFQDSSIRDKVGTEGEGDAVIGDDSEDLLGELSKALKVRDTVFRKGEYKNQLAMLNALSTGRGVAASTPFFFDETDERVLEAVREEPYRHLMAGSLLLVYAQALGLRHLLSLKDPRKKVSSAKFITRGWTRQPLIRDMVLYEHLQNVVMPKYLVPVATWCIAWSPSEGDKDSGDVESQAESLSASASTFSALVQEMGERLLTPADGDLLADAYAYVLEQLLPPPDLPDDDEVVAFTATREGFAQLAANVIDDSVTFPEDARTRMSDALHLIDTELDALAATFLEAKVHHSGSEAYLDTAQMAAYIQTVYPAERIKSMVASIVRSIRDIVSVVRGVAAHEAELEEHAMQSTAMSPASPSTPVPSQPSRKRFKQDLRAASRSPSQSPEKPAATLTGLLPKPVPSPPRAKLTIVNAPSASAAKRSPVVIDLVSPPSSPVAIVDDEEDEKDASAPRPPPPKGPVEVIDLTSPPQSSSSAASTPASQLSSGERLRRQERIWEAEQEDEEAREEAEAEARLAAEEEEREAAAAAAREAMLKEQARRREAAATKESQEKRKAAATPAPLPLPPQQPKKKAAAAKAPKKTKPEEMEFSGEEGMSPGELVVYRKERAKQLRAEQRAAAKEAELKAQKQSNIKGSISGGGDTSEFVCAHCGDEGPEKSVCTQCRSVFYCGGECQRNNWPQHKMDCNSRINGSIAPYFAYPWKLLLMRTGGFAGVREVTTIYSDGRMMHSQKEVETNWGRYTKDLDALFKWAQTVEDVPPPGCCDHFHYSIKLFNTDTGELVLEKGVKKFAV